MQNGWKRTFPPSSHVATTSRLSLGFWVGGCHLITSVYQGLKFLDRMILPHPRGNGTGPGGNKCPDDKLHESTRLVKMTNIILKRILSAEEGGSCFCFGSSLRVSGSPSEVILDAVLFFFFNFLIGGKLFHNVLLLVSVLCSVTQSCPDFFAALHGL